MKAVLPCAMMFGAAVLSGCANVSTDPREGGFFGGVAGINSGAYDERLRERDQRLAELRETQRGLEQETSQLEAQKSATARQVEADRVRVQKLNADVASLDRKVRALSAQEGADQQRVKELQTRLDTLKRQMGQQTSALDALEGSGLGDAETELRRKQLEQQRDGLRREYELLMKMQLELAR